MCERSVGTSVVSLCTTINVPLAWADELLARLQSKGCKSGTWLKLQEGSWCYSVKLERHFKSYLSCWMTELKELILSLHGDIWYLIFLTTVYILFFFSTFDLASLFFLQASLFVERHVSCCSQTHLRCASQCNTVSDVATVALLLVYWASN